MGSFFQSAPTLLAALSVGYLLGALPLADRVSRRRGVDIFSTGTGLAGSSNVRRSVGTRSAVLVFVGDAAKGALSVLIAGYLGIEGPLLILPAAAAIVGHWHSVFSGFRGGDGLATLGGVLVALFGIYGVVSIAVATLVSLGGHKMHYTSLLNIVFGYATLVALNVRYIQDHLLTGAAGGLAAMVLLHAAQGHMRRRQAVALDSASTPPGGSEQPGASTR